MQTLNKLIVYGNASKKVVKILSLTTTDYHLTLLDFLLKNGVPVASSCNGSGSCRKCLVFSDEFSFLSCQKTLKAIFYETNSFKITLSYL